MTASPTPFFAKNANKSDGEHYAKSASCSEAPVQSASADMPSEEDVARVLAEALRQEPIPDDIWASLVASFRKLEAKFPNYPEGYSTSTDAFRQARAVLALFGPILAEKEREIDERDRLLLTAFGERDIALAAEREQCAKVAEDPAHTLDFRARAAIAAAIRAQE